MASKKKYLRVVDDLGRPVASGLCVSRGDDEVVAQFVDGVCALDAKVADELLGLDLGVQVVEFVPSDAPASEGDDDDAELGA